MNFTQATGEFTRVVNSTGDGGELKFTRLVVKRRSADEDSCRYASIKCKFTRLV